MNKPRTDKARALAETATLVGVVNGTPYYEDPIRGDEAPLMCINEAGKAKRSTFWELPDLDLMTGELGA